MHDLNEEDALEIMTIGSKIKTHVIKQAHEEAAQKILAILRAVITEQEKIGNLNHETGLYLLDCVFDFCLRKSYIK